MISHITSLSAQCLRSFYVAEIRRLLTIESEWESLGLERQEQTAEEEM